MGVDERRRGYGDIAVCWEKRGGKLRLTVRAPAGTTGTVRLPGGSSRTVVTGGRAVTFEATSGG